MSKLAIGKVAPEFVNIPTYQNIAQRLMARTSSPMHDSLYLHNPVCGRAAGLIESQQFLESC